MKVHVQVFSFTPAASLKPRPTTNYNVALTHSTPRGTTENRKVLPSGTEAASYTSSVSRTPTSQAQTGMSF